MVHDVGARGGSPSSASNPNPHPQAVHNYADLMRMSIAKSADDEKAQILEALGKMREVTPNPQP